MRCCVPFCKNTPNNVSLSARKGISFHCLPSDMCLRAAWLRALGIQDSPLPDTAVVCSQHFLDDDIYETENGLPQICAGSVPSTVQVCMICLVTDSKLLLMSKYKLEEAYEKLIGHPVCDLGNLKQTLCVQCAQRLINFSSFRDKSLRACALMMDLVEKHEIITRNHIKMINHNKNKLCSHFEVKILGPDHCDAYILEDASEDNKPESFPSLFTTTQVKNEERYDSSADEDTEMANEDDNNAGIIKDEFIVSNEDHLSVDSIMLETILPDDAFGKGLERNLAVAEQVTVTMDPLKCENVPLECTLCSEEFVDEHAYMQHMHMHGQNSDEDPICGTSSVCKPHTVVTSSHSSCLTENKQAIQELNDDPRPSADSAQTFVSPLSVRFATNNGNKAEEANMIQKGIKETKINNEELDSLSFDLSNINRLKNCAVKLYDIIKKPIKSVPMQDKSLAENPYSCELCEFKCKVKDTLVGHMRTHKGEKPYSCELCEFKSKHKRSLKVHMRTHTGEKPYSCELCELKFAVKSHLVQHMRTHTGEKPYACTICEHKCSSNGNLVIHMRTHTGEKPYACELCEFKSKHKRSLKVHMRTHTGEKPYSCELCELKFAVKSHLVQHMRTHTGEKPYACTICEHKCSSNGNLVIHMRTHTGEKPYACTICEHKCSTNGNLVIHMRTHTGEKPYSCELCEFKCRHKDGLVIHMRTHTGEKPYSCKLCEYKCVSSSLLVKHLTTHSGEKPYSCTLCEYKFTSKANLVRHMKTHTGEKPYSCTLCEYKCTLKANLVRHMRTHSGEKPYSCELCEYKCQLNSLLVQHMMTHTGEKPYSCTLCEYKCKCSSHLVRHMRTHSGEKPYSCELCEYKCTLKSSLVIHMRTHTGEKPYSCTLCEYKFNCSSHLVRHMRTHNGEKPYCCELCEYKCTRKDRLLIHMRTHAVEKPLSCELLM